MVGDRSSLQHLPKQPAGDEGHQAGDGGGEAPCHDAATQESRKHGTENDAIWLATGIFVSIVNIFISLLNIFSSR